jgi:hypothetical protein
MANVLKMAIIEAIHSLRSAGLLLPAVVWRDEPRLGREAIRLSSPPQAGHASGNAWPTRDIANADSTAGPARTEEKTPAPVFA